MKKTFKATTISHAWEDKSSTYFNSTNLTGIPAHIQGYVHYEKLSQQITSVATSVTTSITTEMDRRQMGGGTISLELLQERISQPLLNQMNAKLDETLKPFLQNITTGSRAAGASDIVHLPEFEWKSDLNPMPHKLPEDYVLPTQIHPLAIWQQWHHGTSFKDGIAVGALKFIPLQDCPKKYQRRFSSMRKFCKELDKTSGVRGNESIAELGVAFKNNREKWQGLGILLPNKTPSNRTRSRNENGRGYVAQKWESFTRIQKKSMNSEMTVDDLLKTDHQKERTRQKRHRDAANAQKKESRASAADRELQVGEDEGIPPAKRPARRSRTRDVRVEFGVSGSMISALDNLIN